MNTCIILNFTMQAGVGLEGISSQPEVLAEGQEQILPAQRKQVVESIKLLTLWFPNNCCKLLHSS